MAAIDRGKSISTADIARQLESNPPCPTTALPHLGAGAPGPINERDRLRVRRHDTANSYITDRNSLHVSLRHVISRSVTLLRTDHTNSTLLPLMPLPHWCGDK